MVLGEALGSMAIAGSGVWGYNRENFMYDREMRQKQEFMVVSMRLKQAELWREDVRDMIGLTEKKMDNYMIVNALQLGFIITLYTEGRLEPGTPEWLLWLYMLSLSGAFIFLLMSIWLAMHASVVAQGSSTRLLTQLVRPAIPSWEQLESMRTYAYAFEGMNPAQMLRVPVLQTVREGSQGGSGGLSGKADAEPGTAAADPWGLERRGDDIYELQRRALPAYRHMKLIRAAMKHSQAFDAFSRVCMTLGTILLCQSLTYYILGYCLIQDGAPWAAWVAVVVFQSIASIILQMDLSLPRNEHRLAQLFLLGGPFLACIAAAEWASYEHELQLAGLTLLPGCYLCHTAFLILFLRLCHVERQPGGNLLPMAFRSILYLDVFGWLSRSRGEMKSGFFGNFARGSFGFPTANDGSGNYVPLSHVGVSDMLSATPSPDGEDDSSMGGTSSAHDVSGVPGGAFGGTSMSAAYGQRRLAVVHGQNFPRAFYRAPVALRPEDVDRALLSPMDPHGALQAQEDAAFELERDYAEADDTERKGTMPGVGPVGVIPDASEQTFEPHSYAPDPTEDIPAEFMKSGREEHSSGELPWYLFRAAVLLLAAFWFVGGVWVMGQIFGLPDLPVEVLPESVSISGNIGPGGHSLGSTAMHVNDLLPTGERVLAEWPNERFQPWGLSCDSTGQRFVISDEFQLYFGYLDSINAPYDGHAAPTLRLTGIRPAPTCAALEGQAIRDVSLVCEPATGPDVDNGCKALALIDQGLRLAECELIPQLPQQNRWPGGGGGVGGGVYGQAPRGSDAAGYGQAPRGSEAAGYGQAQPGAAPGPRRLEEEVGGLPKQRTPWTISSNWLRLESVDGGLPEEVESVAVDIDCNRSGFQKKLTPQLQEQELAILEGGGDWCIIVGTSHGRMVRLRRHLRRENLLVPEGVLWNVLDVRRVRSDDEKTMASSLLHMISGGFLLKLRNHGRRVHAIDAVDGRIIGEWRLPEIPGHTWFSLAGGSEHIFVVSQRNDGETSELWRFPAPPELRMRMVASPPVASPPVGFSP